MTVARQEDILIKRRKKVVPTADSADRGEQEEEVRVDL